jgi:SPP1 family predicted phage head-tail adaptor
MDLNSSRITIQSRSSPPTDAGDQSITWVDMLTIWATRRANPGSERYTGVVWAGHGVVTFTIRWSRAAARVTSRHRILCDGKAYNIIDAREIGRRQGIEIDAWTASD